MSALESYPAIPCFTELIRIDGVGGKNQTHTQSHINRKDKIAGCPGSPDVVAPHSIYLQTSPLTHAHMHVPSTQMPSSG